MRVSLPIVLAALLAAALPVPLLADDSGSDSEIAVGISPYNYPYEFINPDGRADGLIPALLREIAADAGFALEFRAGVRRERFEWLRSDQVDLVGAYAAIPDTSGAAADPESVACSRPYLDYEFEIFVRDDNRSIFSAKDLEGKTIAVVKHGTAGRWLRSQPISCRLLEADSGPAMFQLLAEGRADGAVFMGRAGRHLIGEMNLAHIIPVAAPPLFTVPCRFAVAQSKLYLLPHLDEGLGILKGDGRYRALVTKWLGPSPEPHAAWKHALTLLAATLAALLLTTGLVLAWSLLLRRQVRSRTAELNRSREMVRELFVNRERAAEEERQIIAREIHDALGQNLTALKLSLASLDRRLPAERVAEREATVGALKLAESSLGIVRDLSQRLRAGILEELGLAEALKWQLTETGRAANLRTEFLVSPGFAEPAPKIADALFRIGQEALTNVLRHSGATAVTLALKQQPDELKLRIEDNGRGVRDEELAKPHCFGLRGMRERVAYLGGILSVTGQPGRGTTVAVALPRRKETF